jgi:ubiquinone/menaquinone biosynthesis C-methylase UbiE
MNGKAPQMQQTIENLRGEIEFRAKLALQHVSGEVLLPDYYKKDEHDRILWERVEMTRKKMTELSGLGINFSPFLELGAERGQRSLVLANDFGANGVAIDISYHQLKTMEHFSHVFKMEKLPLRICCNANHLPFKSNSFPFIFCYEFLHHFPSLQPVMKEVHRVSSDGYFYFDEEPFKRVMKLALYRQKAKIYSERTLRKNKYVTLIESFISDVPCDEVEHGIVENDNISLMEWINALSLFDEREIDLSSINRFKSKLEGRFKRANIPNYLLGGTITGLCRKKLQPATNVPADMSDILGCPDCRISTNNESFDRPSLVELGDSYQCSHCGFNYPSRDGVVFLLPRSELQQLYPTF